MHHGFVQVKSGKISIAVKLCEEKIDLERAKLSEKTTAEKIASIGKEIEKAESEIQEKFKIKFFALNSSAVSLLGKPNSLSRQRFG